MSCLIGTSDPSFEGNESNVIMQNDVLNAFNETSHVLIEEGLQVFFPDLIHILKILFF